MTDDITGYADRLQASQRAEQGSAAWIQARVGKVTASNFRLVMDFLKGGKPSAKREGYLWDVVIERLTGNATEHFVSGPMQWGTEYEAQARMAYEQKTGRIVESVGFIDHPTIAGVGGSPDGLIDDDGLIEIKCPTTRTHCGIVLENDIAEYSEQMQGLMWITGRQYCDFVSFDPRLPEGLRLYVYRLPRLPSAVEEISEGVIKFLAEVKELHARLALKVASSQADTDSPSITGNPAGPADDAFDLATQA